MDMLRYEVKGKDNLFIKGVQCIMESVFAEYAARGHYYTERIINVLVLSEMTLPECYTFCIQHKVIPDIVFCSEACQRVFEHTTMFMNTTFINVMTSPAAAKVTILAALSRNAIQPELLRRQDLCQSLGYKDSLFVDRYSRGTTISMIAIREQRSVKSVYAQYKKLANLIGVATRQEFAVKSMMISRYSRNLLN
ncbi:hypothetical protein TUM12370_26500 [Salmonella enterica subsp. enterica serovar Choleraesuis]|nr:hypothetical protein TUM12370_26500 [Salmonella enterica subsp. enterica serovar Choleraesuis]